MNPRRKGFCLLGTIIVIAVVVVSCPIIAEVAGNIAKRTVGLLG